MDEFARKVSEGRDGAHWEIIRLNALARYPIAKRRLEALAANDFADWRDARLTQVKPATVAREMNLMRSVLEVARRDWKWSRVRSEERRVGKEWVSRCRSRWSP